MRKLDFTRKLVLSVAGVLALVAPIVFGQAITTQSPTESQAENPAFIAPVFEVASIKPSKPGSMFVPGGKSDFPNYFTRRNLTVELLIFTAFGVSTEDRISGVPNWAKSEQYDIEAKLDSSVVDELKNLNLEQYRLLSKVVLDRMIQAMLEERFQLKFHHETKELPVYALVVAKNGPKLHESTPGDTYPNGFKLPDGRPLGPNVLKGLGRGQIAGQGASMELLIGSFVLDVDRPVIDKTGLKGKYDFTLHWTPEQRQNLMVNANSQGPPPIAPLPDSSGPSIFDAIQEQLGLKLVPQKGPVEVLVIDHVEKPSPN